jgi:hypothetical protein
LLQGVNLPARNIFLFKPEKGSRTPTNADDFWNLAGRAGRLKKDIHGNVFLVSYDTWKNRPVHETPSRCLTNCAQRPDAANLNHIYGCIRDKNRKR